MSQYKTTTTAGRIWKKFLDSRIRDTTIDVLSGVNEHIRQERLMQLAAGEVRPVKDEFEHFETCSQCLAAYAKSILEFARARAKEKCTPPAISPE